MRIHLSPTCGSTSRSAVLWRGGEGWEDFWLLVDSVKYSQENDMDTRDWSERCFDAVNIRNPFELRNDELPEQPNYFTCAFRRDKIDK